MLCGTFRISEHFIHPACKADVDKSAYIYSAQLKKEHRILVEPHAHTIKHSGNVLAHKRPVGA